MKPSSILLAGLLLLPIAAEAAPAAAGEAPLRVGRISIECQDVFTPQEASKGWLYETANVIHIATREAVVRRFLTFREGDAYDPRRLAESERNLRAQAFIRSASVTAGEPRDGVVDVRVVTQDVWSTEPSASYGHKGGKTTFAFKLVERNLLGPGSKLEVGYIQGIERSERQILFFDPQLFGPYTEASLLYSNNSDGREEAAELGRPFYSLTTPWSATASFDDALLQKKLYGGGSEVARFEQDHRDILAEYGIALTASEAGARRLRFGFDAVEDRFRHLPSRPEDLLPEDRRFRFLLLHWDRIDNGYLKIDYIDAGSRFQDFNLGAVLSLEAGISPRLFGLDRTTGLLGAAGSRGAALGTRGFLLGSFSGESRLDGGFENARLTADLRGAWKTPSRFPQTTVFRLHGDRGWNLDRDVQFFADGLTGLRGYRLYAFSGDKTAIVNVEHRIHLGRELFQLVEPGLALFVDSGTAAPPGTRLRLSDFKTDAGFGLRFQATRASVPVIRLDFAWALDRDARGRSGLLISASSGTAF
jgi:hypothetical protein